MFDLDKLSNFKIFQGFSADDLNKLLSIATKITFNRRDLLLEEAKPSDGFYIIIEGRARVDISQFLYGNGIDDDRLELAILRPGDIFGEISFLTGSLTSARVWAIDNGTALNIQTYSLKKIIEENYRIGYILMKNIATILANRIVDINFKMRSNIC
ncbi:MAG: cyclic nucleotide-binding domain-containing protein [Pseudomonadota bacterium]